MDTVSFGSDREPRRLLAGRLGRPRGQRPHRRWSPPRWAGWVAVATTVTVVATVVVATTRGPGQHAEQPGGNSMPALLSGVPARGNRTDLILGGDNFWRVTDGKPHLTMSHVLAHGVSALLPSGDPARISQLVPVSGGVVAMLDDTSRPRLDSTLGRVVYISADGGAPLVIARASMMAVAPGGRSVWVQTAVASRTRGPAPKPVPSPTFAVSLSGQRVSPVFRLPLGLVAATASGLVTRSLVNGRLQTWDQRTGRPLRQAQRARAVSGLIVAAVPGLVIWRSAACENECPLQLTDPRAWNSTIRPPAGWWPLQYPEPTAYSARRHQVVLAFGKMDSSANPTQETLFVIDTATRAITKVPGGPVFADQPLGLSDPGVQLAGSWDQRGVLWVLATSGYGYFQLGYWTGSGPLHVFPPAHGMPVMLAPAR